MPLVSVLLPAYQAAGTLAACLRSLERQTEPDWQCVLVDDGSTDGTAECARRFAAIDHRIEVLSLPHRGLVAALRAGLARASGEFVARLDADDLMHRDRLAAQVELLRRDPALSAVGCHVRLFPRAGLKAGLRAYERWLNQIDGVERLKREAFVECPVAHPTLMIRQRVLGAFGYRECGWPEDYDLVLRLLAAGHAVGMVPRRLYAWRDGPSRLSRTHPAYSIESFTACRANFLAAGFLAATERYVLWGYGSTGRALGRALAERGKRLAYVVELHPGRLGNSIHGAPVIPPERLVRLDGRLPIVVSVAGAGPRGEIRAALEQMGFAELSDFVCAA